MRRLVALSLPPSAAFVTELERAWDGGDAVLPVDPRLPPARRKELLDTLAPAVLVDETGERHLLGGAVPVEEGDALVVATSGTTGEPKGAVLTHAAVAASANATSARLGVDPDRDRWLACLPVAHVGGLSVVTRALLTGTPIDLLERFDTDSVLDAAHHGASLVSLVPTTLSRLRGAAGDGGSGRGDGSGLFRTILLGGAAPPDELPPNVVTTYGMTETGSGVVYDGVPLEGVEISIGVAGEILVRSPTLMRCYRDGSDPRLPGGWLATGDTGTLDEAGHLTVFGRISELIISGGENVWPAAVEAVLLRDAWVAEVAVAGRPDPEWGERVVAFIVPAPGSGLDRSGLDGSGSDGSGSDGGRALAELRELVAAELGNFAAPRELVQVDTLPRTSGGKLRRHLLSAGDAGAERHDPWVRAAGGP